MIAHVAESGEKRGRVVLQLSSGEVSEVALAAAMRIAAAFKSEIESLFVEDEQLFDLAAFPFCSEISLSGRNRADLSPDRMARQLRHLAHILNRRIAALAAAAEIPFSATVVRNEPVAAVADACERLGPWNVVALAEPLARSNVDRLRRLFETVHGTTGVVIVGRHARRATGPIIAAIDDMDHLEPALRAAARLRDVSEPAEVRLILIAADEDEGRHMEDQTRLILGDDLPASVARVCPRFGSPAEVWDRLRRDKPGFVITRFGGFLAPGDSDLEHLVAALECPLFLIR